ncbi:MAG: hypothetical protein WKF43_14385 [Acidimicrobiales bacterium]
MTPPATIVLLVGGDEADWSGSPSLVEAGAVPSGAVVVAADSTARGCGVGSGVTTWSVTSTRPIARPSLPPNAGTVVHRHPADKDATDSELARSGPRTGGNGDEQFEVAPADRTRVRAVRLLGRRAG